MRHKFLWAPGGLTETFIDLTSGAAEVGYAVTPWPYPQEPGGKIKEARQAFLKYRGESQPHLYDAIYLEGWSCVEVAIEAIRIAIRDYGYDNLT